MCLVQVPPAITWFDVVSLGVTVGLGVMSVVLGGFAIWLSRHFDTKSSAALDSIKDLATELRSLTAIAVAQQKDFSTKMLDSILRRDQYASGSPDDAADDVAAITKAVEMQLKETEGHLLSKVESEMRELAGSTRADPALVETALAEIRGELRELRKEATLAATAPLDLPTTLKLHLARWQKTPAYFVLLAAIARSDATNVKGLLGLRDTYHFPIPVEPGLERLIKRGFLTGTTSTFSVPEAIRLGLKKWVDQNWPALTQLFAAYQGQDGSPASDQRIMQAASSISV